MTTLTARPKGQLALAPERQRRHGLPLERIARERDRCSDGGRLTLEQKLDRVWEGLLAAGVAACPVCGTQMRRDRDAHASCGGCGARLS